VIYYGKQSIEPADIEAVVEILQSDLITQGPVSRQFEVAVARYVGAQHGVAVSHGSAALHLACLSLGVGNGDVVWTVPNTFVASANCALYCGADIDFVDINESTFNISLDALEQKLISSESNHTLPKVLVLVHFAGTPCDLQEIKALSTRYGFYIVEDACHALGASYQQDKIGSCRYSDITVFSFHPVKSITTGEGGMLLTNDASIASKARLFASHGITRDRELMTRKNENEWYYEQHELGFNYRITDIQSALGLSQLKRLDQFIVRRSDIAAMYLNALNELPVVFQTVGSHVESAYHLFPVTIDTSAHVDKDQLFDAMKAGGVTCGCHYIPVHLQPFYQKKGFKAGDYPNAERYYEHALSLPIYPSLSDDDLGKVVNLVNEILS
jgi:UDP-4-amino-4,6-dideoxy-N-acetyl-beta-L-altrosamine transaminase